MGVKSIVFTRKTRVTENHSSFIVFARCAMCTNFTYLSY